jgi:hypothetical protein
MAFNAGETINQLLQGFLAVDVGMGVAMAGRRMGYGLGSHGVKNLGKGGGELIVIKAIVHQ